MLFGEFKKFIMRGNVIDLAIAVIIGLAFGAVITSVVNDLIGPIIGAILGGVNLAGQTLKIGTVEIGTGNFASRATKGCRRRASYHHLECQKYV